MANDPTSAADLYQSGIPSTYTDQLTSLGYVGQPFATPEQTFQNQNQFQQLLKRILDAQLGGYQQYGVGPSNLAGLPYGMRGMFTAASNALTDPMYGNTGNNAFFGGGYKMGDIPSARAPAFETWYNATHGYPNVPAPSPVSASAGGGGNGVNTNAANQGTPANYTGPQSHQYTVTLPGGGTITVNAHDSTAAVENAQQQTGDKSWSGYTPGVKPGAYQSF